MEMREILVNEIDEVAGGVGPGGAAIGAVASGISYWASNDNPNSAGLFLAVGTGALGGFFGGWAGAGIQVFGGLGANEIIGWM